MFPYQVFRLWITSIVTWCRSYEYLLNELLFPVKNSQEPGWLEGTLNGKTGLIPENYVEILPWQGGSLNKLSTSLRDSLCKALHLNNSQPDVTKTAHTPRLSRHRQSLDSTTTLKQLNIERKSSTWLLWNVFQLVCYIMLALTPIHITYVHIYMRQIYYGGF